MYKNSEIIWKADEDGELRAYHKKNLIEPVAWAPQVGSQTMFLECPVFECLYEGNRGPGKASHVDALVLCKYGWKRMGDLAVGEVIRTPKGHLSPVTHIYDFESKPMYRITFTDGASTRVSDEHLWKACTFDSDFELHTTLELIKLLNKGEMVFIPQIAKLTGAARPVTWMDPETPFKSVLSIEYIGEQPARCIRVDDPDHLYITDDFIVTHNTDALLWDYLKDVGRGFGADWKGMILRRTHPELEDVQKKCQKWIPKVFPTASFNVSKSRWTFPDGEILRLAFMKDETDYNRFHGSEFSWIGWEELTTWPTDKAYKLGMSILRSTGKGVPIRVRATTNPSGTGHNWVKTRFGLPHQPGKLTTKVIIPDGDRSVARVAIHGSLKENRILLHANPSYMRTIIEACEGDPNKYAAWVDGSWDILSGGMFNDIWKDNVHIVRGLDIREIPQSWRIDRSYDHGQAKPFSVGWWAQSSGETMTTSTGRVIGGVRGDLFRIMEWYGAKPGVADTGLYMGASKIAQGIKERTIEAGLAGRVWPGLADASIFAVQDGENTTAGLMAKERVQWLPAYKGKWSRTPGWEKMREMLSHAVGSVDEDGVRTREKPGLFISDRCVDFLRLIPNIGRDKKNPDDVDTNSEDHIADEARYRVMAKQAKKAQMYSA